MAFGQAPQPEFEVASIKTFAGTGLPESYTLNPGRSGGRFSWTNTLSGFINYAYQLPAWQVSWPDSGGAEHSFFAIAAAMPASSTEEQARLMLRRLLTDRFHIVSHSQTKELQGFELMVAKNGPKLGVASPTGEPPPLPPYFGGKASAAFEGQTITSVEGPGALAITGRRVPIARLARQLSETLGGPVVDRTGLTGLYYFGFRFANPADLRPDVDVPTALAAVQEELGLRLESRKLSAEILVITKFDRQPSEN